MNYKLSPSDFAFLWEECKRCFYLKVKNNIYRPSPPMPGIFMVIDSEMKKCFKGKDTQIVTPAMPKGVIEEIDGDMVESEPIKLDNKSSTCYIRGKIDTIVKFDDGTFGVIDFKTSKVKEENLAKYGRQLHAYALALENPTDGKLSRNPVSKLGLVVYEPNEFLKDGEEKSILKGDLCWVEIPRDDSAFMKFLDDVITLLENPEPPDSEATCKFCAYRSSDTTDELDSPTCPTCKGKMVKRDGKRGKFWGCTNYPDCRGTRNI